MLEEIEYKALALISINTNTPTSLRMEFNSLQQCLCPCLTASIINAVAYGHGTLSQSQNDQIKSSIIIVKMVQAIKVPEKMDR